MAWPRWRPWRDRTELKRLRQSEARFRALADSAGDLLVQYDVEGVIQYASPSAVNFGLRPEDLVGRHVSEFTHPDDRGRVANGLEDLKAGQPPRRGVENERRILKPDGSWVWVQGHPTSIHDEDGRLVGVLTILRDVSERRALEELLAAQRTELNAAFERVAESEQRYRLLAEQSPDIIVRYDLEGRVEYVSPAIGRYGVDPQDLIGRKLEDLLAPSEHGRKTAWMAELAAGRDLPQGRKNVWRTPMRSGGWADWEGATNPLVEDGKVIGAISVMRDVTEREALEEALRAKQAQTQVAMEQYRESEARYRVLAENASDVIVRIGATGLIEFASPSIAMFGYRPDEVTGRLHTEFVHPDDLIGNVRAAIRDGQPIPRGPDNEFRLRCRNGRWALVQGSPAVIRNEAGEIEGVVTVLRDVSEQRRLEDELRRKEADAQAAVRAKAEFLANMSHEIRTPLTAVVGFSSLLAKIPGLPEKARTYADRIGRSGEALASLVNTVLDFSRVEAGQVELKPEPLEVAGLIEDAFGVVREQAAAKGLALQASIAPDAPPGIVADAGRLRQVLLNLLTNAVKFTHEGVVAIEITYEAEARRLRLAVRDTGIGIAPSVSDRLFKRFSQVESSNSRRFGGVGLGLAISKGLVELMGGEIGVESAEGRGSTFWFAIPVSPTDAPGAQSDRETAPTLAPLKVLLVDDARPNRELIAALLGPFDCRVVEADNGLDAVEAARREAFDVVLMDLQMPGMDGMAAAREIRRTATANQDTPILAVSASVLPADVAACRDAGMNDHVAKPIDAGILIRKLAHWTAGGRGGPVVG
jgi:PAS domain S-box-containing protein